MEIMSKVAKEIIELRFEETDTLKHCYDQFLDIMRKHGIKRGIRKDNGVQCDTPEWGMFRAIFKERIMDYFMMKNIFDEIEDEFIGEENE